jgi:hypothetical protein
MEEFEIEYEINDAISCFQKGQTAIQIRRNIIEKGISKEFASQISKEAYFRFLHQNSRIKINRGLLWLIGGVITSIILFQVDNKFSYIAIFGSFWGLFQVFSGISNKRSANDIKSNLSQ